MSYLKKFTAAFIIVTILLSTALFCSCDSDNSLRTVRVNEVTHSVFYAPFYAAISLGYFEEEDILIDLTNGGGSDKSMTALISSQADIGLMGPETAVYVANEGRENHAVIFAQLTQRDGSFLLGKSPDTDFNWQKLEGKSVIGGRTGGMPQMTLDYVLKSYGLISGENITVRTDVQFDLMGGAFIAGQDDYVTMFEPSASTMELNGEGYIVASVGAEAGEIPYTCFMATKEFISENGDLIEAFTRALYKGQIWVDESDSSEVAKVIAPLFPDNDIELLNVVVSRYQDINAWKTNPYMTSEAYNMLIEVITAAGIIDKSPEYANIIDNSFADMVIGE